MAHLVEQMAYVGATPWHGLGQQLSRQQPLEVWQQQAGMNWHIEEAPVRFIAEGASHLGSIHSFPEQKVLYRSDTKAPLSVVSQRYKVVQPEEILEFYRDLTEYAGYELETAGVLKGGRKFWALARSGLSTSQAVKVPHRSEFDPRALKSQLGISVSQWNDFMYRMKALAERKIDHREAQQYFQSVLCGIDKPIEDPSKLPNYRALNKVQKLYHGEGRGSHLDTAKDTAWGLLNAVTEYVDHDKRARSNDTRLDSAWFGQGAQLKQEALQTALALVS